MTVNYFGKPAHTLWISPIQYQAVNERPSTLVFLNAAASSVNCLFTADDCSYSEKEDSNQQ